MERTTLFLLLSLGLVSGSIKVYEASGDDCATMFYTELFEVTLADSQSLDLNDEANYTGSCSSIGPTMTIAFTDVEVGNSTLSDVEVTITFSTTDTGYWSSETVKVSYTEDGTTTTGEGTFNSADMISQDFSYACTYTTIYDLSNSMKLELELFQLQAVNVENNKFAESYQCVNWISKGAWMGIFAGLILIITTILSIMMLMSVTTPDRFETSKSKCLIIPHEH